MRSKLLIILLTLSITGFSQTLEEGFYHPPAAAKPWVFWYWMQGAVSKEGIRADLEAMRSAGIGGAYLMPIKGVKNPPLTDTPVEQLSPAWWEMVRYAMQEADRSGVKLAMHVCDGFAVAGGPWITPEMSMQKVTSSKVFAEGKVDMQLPMPPMHEGYYRDVAVYALPVSPGWEQSTRTVAPKVTSEGATIKEGSIRCDGPCWVQYAFGQPFTCRTIIISATNNYQAQRLLIQASDDGEHFRQLGRLEPPRHGWEDNDADVTHTIPAVTARYFRFVYDKRGSEPGAEDLDAAKWKPSLKVGSIGLSAMPSVDQYEGKAGEVWRISRWSGKHQLPDSICIARGRVMDISHYMDTSGRLTWTAPPGRWMVLRVGHTSTGHRNVTGGGGAGLECDKLNPAVAALQFDKWFG
ncbi:MAG TPA: glycosyl hydrolase, partial [Puia sp.]|nr:glycosyl hydrolase [Puia sp.]